MKKISTLLLASFLITALVNAQTYNVTSNRNWSSYYPTSCNNCTFNISNGVTLTIDRNVTLQNPVFNGGTVVVNNNQVTLHTNSNKKSYFNDTKFILNNSSWIDGAAPIVITNSVFTFNSTSRIKPQHLFEVVNSRLNFNEDSYLLATGGPVNLKDKSLLVGGDGTLSSDAYINILGPTLTLYDNSAIIIANVNNYYYNWSPYYGAAANKWNSTAVNSFNCGGANPHGCTPPFVYGPVNIMPNGVSAGNSLPVVLSDFSVRLHNNQTEINWITDQESNSDRFEIERSMDGINWITIAKIAAKGNSSLQSKYAFIDRAPAAGINYYRLKMIDLDTRFEYSESKSVRTTLTSNVRVYPNPASNFVQVSVPVAASVVRLMNTAGQVMQERKSINAGTSVSFDITNYTAGTYMVQVIQQDGLSRNNVLLIAK